MQTTLRIDDTLYREAKAEAARTGVSLTRFLEEGLRLRLEKQAPPAAHRFRTYAPEKVETRLWQEICSIADEEQEASDLAKLSPRHPEP